MENKKGLFIVFEGIDGSGKTTQIERLANYIRKKDKYQDVLLTREPTWRATNIKSILTTSNDAYSGGLRCAEYFIDDRAEHVNSQILPALEQGAYVLCDRFTLSTLGYQSTQRVDLSLLIQMHNDRKIITPDLTFFVDTPVSVAVERRLKRGDPAEKFEKDTSFQEELRNSYISIVEQSYNSPEGDLAKLIGKVFTIYGNRSVEEINRNIFDVYSEATKI